MGFLKPHANKSGKNIFDLLTAVEQIEHKEGLKFGYSGGINISNLRIEKNEITMLLKIYK